VPENFVPSRRNIQNRLRVSDVVFGFDDGLAGIAAFQFGKLCGVRANLLRELVKNATRSAAVVWRQGPESKRRARFDGRYRRLLLRRTLRADHFFGSMDRKRETSHRKNSLPTGR